MLFQITLSRVLSVVVWYHYGFLILSMVMLGLGAPGVWLALVRRPLAFLPPFLLAAGLSLPLSIILLVKFGMVMHEQSILLLILCFLVPLLSLGGATCCLLMKARGSAVGRLYGLDLFGACLGAVVAIPLMHAIPTPQLAAATGFLPLFALLLERSRVRGVAIFLLVALPFVLAATNLYQISGSKVKDERGPAVYEVWTPLAHLTVKPRMEKNWGFTWGRGDQKPPVKLTNPPPEYWIDQDGSAGTPITRFDGALAPIQHLLNDVTAAGHLVLWPQRVAIIGGGGGRDILTALAAHAKEIEVVELNRAMVDIVSNVYREFSGDPYHAPGVTAHVGDGRSYLEKSEGRFDLIQISLIDSWAASAAGSFALAENNLYTVEAFDLYLSRLAPGGMLSVSRWTHEMPRLITLAAGGLRAHGITDPSRHMLLLRGSQVVTLLLARDPVPVMTYERLKEVAKNQGFVIIYPATEAVLGPVQTVARDLVEGRYQVLAQHDLNTAPPTDDSPYFFHVASPFRPLATTPPEVIRGVGMNWTSLRVLKDAMIAVGAITALLFFLPFAGTWRRTRQAGALLQLAIGTIYFAAIGAGFMLMENMMIQRFVLYLGHPTLSTTVILSSLLVGMGVGSLNAARLGVHRLRRYGLAAAVVLAGLTFWLPPLFGATLSLTLLTRILLSACILIPLGALLGCFFPLGMVLFGEAAKPWMWAVNGAAGVLASVFSLALSMDFGFSTVGKLSALLYLLAWALFYRARAS